MKLVVGRAHETHRKVRHVSHILNIARLPGRRNGQGSEVLLAKLEDVHHKQVHQQ
jgi:hypothetical protein